MEQPVFMIIGICAAVPVVIAAILSKHPLRRLALGAAQGLSALAAVNVAGAFTGVSIGIGWLSLATAGILGLPGVTALLFIQYICH